MKPVGKPDAGNPHVRFDERGLGNGTALRVSTRARPRLYRRSLSGKKDMFLATGLPGIETSLDAAA